MISRNPDIRKMWTHNSKISLHTCWYVGRCDQVKVFVFFRGHVLPNFGLAQYNICDLKIVWFVVTVFINQCDLASSALADHWYTEVPVLLIFVITVLSCHVLCQIGSLPADCQSFYYPGQVDKLTTHTKIGLVKSWRFERSSILPDERRTLETLPLKSLSFTGGGLALRH